MEEKQPDVEQDMHSLSVGTWQPPSFERVTNLIEDFCAGCCDEDTTKTITDLKELQSSIDTQTIFQTYCVNISWMDVVKDMLYQFPQICLFGDAVRDLICHDCIFPNCDGSTTCISPRDLDFGVFATDVFWKVMQWIPTHWSQAIVHPSTDPWLHAHIEIPTGPSSCILMDVVYKEHPRDNLDMDVNGCQLWWQPPFFEIIVPFLHGGEPHRYDTIGIPGLYAQSHERNRTLIVQIKHKIAHVCKWDPVIKVRIMNLMEKGWTLDYKCKRIVVGNCMQCNKKDLLLETICYDCIPF